MLAPSQYSLRPLAAVPAPPVLHVFNAAYASLFAVSPASPPTHASLALHESVSFEPFDTHAALHLLSGGRALFVVTLADGAQAFDNVDGGIARARRVSFAVDDASAASDSSHRLFLVASPLLDKRVHLMYCAVVALPSPLSHFALSLVVGMESTLVRYYDMVAMLPPRESELAMLAQFDQSGAVTLPGGRVVAAELEETLADDCEPAFNGDGADAPWGQTKWRPSMWAVAHPVIRLNSAHGAMVLTRLCVEGSFKSFIVHVRPGWTELKAYLDGKTTGSRTPLYALRPVLKHTAGNLGKELCRLLVADAAESTVALFDELDVFKAVGGSPLDLVVALDNSARWAQPERVWPVRAYDPYSSDVDCSLAVALQMLHALRNDFFLRCDELRSALNAWCAGACAGKQPDAPHVAAHLALQRHRWLQEFQATTGSHISHELAQARDYADIALRNRFHVVVDTNVLLLSAQDDFALFAAIRAAHEQRVVVVVPFAVLGELDWQKHNARDEAKRQRAQQCIRFVNGFVALGSNWLVLQSQQEDAAYRPEAGGNHNGANDLRILAAANSRHHAGLRTILVSGDINLRNFSLGAGVPALNAMQLWGLMSDARMRQLPPEHWVAAAARSVAA